MAAGFKPGAYGSTVCRSTICGISSHSIARPALWVLCTQTLVEIYNLPHTERFPLPYFQISDSISITVPQYFILGHWYFKTAPCSRGFESVTQWLILMSSLHWTIQIRFSDVIVICYFALMSSFIVKNCVQHVQLCRVWRPYNPSLIYSY